MRLWTAVALFAGLAGRPGSAWDKPDPVDIDAFVYARVSAGRLRGFATRTHPQGRPAYVFKRIPFAQPPVGALRFAPLRPLARWPGADEEEGLEWDATQYGPACMSNTTRTTSPQWPIAEDCLHANVFTSPACMEGRKRGRCPVLFYIHGGNFAYDSAVMFNDRQIIDKYAGEDVLFVICAYRLGVFGFLDLGADDIVRRNLGLYDIQFGLRWTAAEIGAFGGDPARITVMGNSGGADAIQYMLLLRRRAGTSGRPLFAQAVLSSPAPYFKPDRNVDASRALLEEFRCLPNGGGGESAAELRAAVDCLRGVGAKRLINAQAANERRDVLFRGVGTDEDLPAEHFSALFPQLRPIRLLVTTTPDEFLEANTAAQIDPRCAEYAQYFGYPTRGFRRACLALYVKTNDTRRIVPEALHTEADLLAAVNRRHGGVSFRGSFALAGHRRHADDLLFFAGMHWMRNATMTPAERLMDRYYPQMIRTFVRYGRPEPAWRPISADGAGYMMLDFGVDDDGAVRGRPHFRAGEYVNPTGRHFWLTEALRIDRFWRPIESANLTAPPFTELFMGLETQSDGNKTASRMKARASGEANDDSRSYDRSEDYALPALIVLACALAVLAAASAAALILSRRHHRRSTATTAGGGNAAPPPDERTSLVRR